jgi:glycosyltransferase involved in cell wall biosynthesis
LDHKALISVIIPARNEEASISRAIESLALQPDVTEIIVVDDQSTDRTGQILKVLAGRVAKLRVIEAGELPSGWTGKNHAASLGASAATGDWLLFTDADTYHYLGSTRRALADAVDHDAVLVSYSPEQEMETFWERALIPFVYWRLSRHFSYARINDPHRSDAAANGQFVLVLRTAYEEIGGHAAIAPEILEDVALARRMKKFGHRIYFTAPVGVVRTRMYRSFSAMWQGWTKNLYPLVGGKVSSMTLEFAQIFPWLEIVVFGLLWIGLASFHDVSLWWVALFALVALVERELQYAIELHRNLYPVSYVQYYVPGVTLYSAALIVSWWKNSHGRVVWKGRAYPANSR